MRVSKRLTSSVLAELLLELPFVFLAFCILHTHGGSVCKEATNHTGVRDKSSDMQTHVIAYSNSLASEIYALTTP